MTSLTFEQLSAMTDWELLENWYKRIKKPWGKHPHTVIEKIWKKAQQITSQPPEDILRSVLPEDILRSVIHPKKWSHPLDFLIAAFLEEIIGHLITRIDAKLLMTDELESIVKILEEYDYGKITSYLSGLPKGGIEKVALQNSMLATSKISMDDKAKHIGIAIHQIKINFRSFLVQK